MSGRCLESVWKISGGILDGVSWVSGQNGAGQPGTGQAGTCKVGIDQVRTCQLRTDQVGIGLVKLEQVNLV